MEVDRGSPRGWLWGDTVERGMQAGEGRKGVTGNLLSRLSGVLKHHGEERGVNTDSNFCVRAWCETS